MHGQWIGEVNINDETKANVILNLDDFGNYICGTAYVCPHDRDISCTYAEIPNLDPTQTKHQFEAQIWPTDRTGYMYIPDSDGFKSAFPYANHGHRAEISIEFDNNAAFIKYQSPGVSTGSGNLHRQFVNQASDYLKNAEVLNWQEFKQQFQVQKDDMRRSTIYRGQPCMKKLRTKFHRSNRKDLRKYKSKDIPQIHSSLTGFLSQQFNLSDPFHLGAFYNLIQHHGYPTPLLDWTYSPYVAAFHALYTADPREHKHVPVYSFEKTNWEQRFSQIKIIDSVFPHFSIIDLLTMENPRALPQQALAALTNIDDIETYIHEREGEAKERFLSAIKLRTADKDIVLQDLELMGITNATLFPGIDSTCNFQRDINFRYFDEKA